MESEIPITDGIQGELDDHPTERYWTSLLWGVIQTRAVELQAETQLLDNEINFVECN